jgi:glycosyltransferase involved in cell wall biosynthesis
MTRMKIILMHYSAPPIVGGVESVLAHQARLISGAGHAVQILAARGEPQNEKIGFLRLPLVDSLDPEILAVKKELDAGRVPPAFALLVNRLMDQLRPALKSADILIAHNVCSLNKNLVLTEALHQLYREPGFPRLILWHHDLAWKAPRYLPELHSGHPWDLLRIDWPGAVQVTISASRQQELSDLAEIPLENIHVIPNGILAEDFLKLEEKTIGFISSLDLWQAAPILLVPVRITRRKNLELALTTLARLRDVFPNAVMIVTGPVGAHNPENIVYFRELLALRGRLGLDASAFFLAELSDSFLPDSVIADFYRLADALFLPSREEGFGIPVLEAGLTHSPVFCADLPALRELGEENVTYFSSEDEPGHVASLIAGRLRDDPVFQLAEKVRREFNWDRIYRDRIGPLLAEVRNGTANLGDGI